jgi:hypothetical protein
MVNQDIAPVPKISEILTAIDWINKAIEYLKPYKPLKKRMKINYNNRTSEIALLLNIPNRLKLKFTTTRIPAYQNFHIKEMMAEDFSSLNINDYWKRQHDGSWVLNSKGLPNCENFLIKLEGKMPTQTISQLVFVDESMNRDQSKDSDRYWLKCMIRDVELVEQIWDNLEIDDVNVGIKVGINKCFSSAIPSAYVRKIKATQRFIKAGHKRDREELFKAWFELHRSQDSRSTTDDLIELINRLTSGELFENYVFVEEPFDIGSIDRDTDAGILPNFMNVQARTDLNLKQDIADGFLIFNKKQYINDIKQNLGD